MKCVVKNVDETFDLARSVADGLQGGEIILLNGELGAGKTTFTKGLAKALGITEVVTSPTFTFMKSYCGRLNLYHFDMYRVENEDELFELGLNDYLNAKDGVCVIEWNKFENLSNTKVINITTLGKNKREFEIL
ncbi:MAG: tRNA (adenosine(37)-N6)-threonylcarbamoyltransferase complex ATPase subunit type 1 TsaE [Clostridia bacterium]